MLKRISIAAVAGALSLVSAAQAENTRQVVTYVGGHNGIMLVQVKPASDRTAPYALTGERPAQARRFEPIWVGSRIAGFRPAN